LGNLTVKLLFLLGEELDVSVCLLLLVFEFSLIDLFLEHLGFEVEVGPAGNDEGLLSLHGIILVGLSALVLSLKLASQVINLSAVGGFEFVEFSPRQLRFLNIFQVLLTSLSKLLFLVT